MQRISDTELILNPDGSIYHLNLLPEQIAKTIITVGDPDRVKTVSRHFDRIEFRVQKREFTTHTGYIGNKRLSVISTGIGTDNIDIVLNELDALVNIDFKTRTIKPTFIPLQFIRLGTSGCLIESIPIDTILVSKYAIGLDSLMHYYPPSLSKQAERIQHKLRQVFKDFSTLSVTPYIAESSDVLLQQLGNNLKQGITLTASGFYAPQGRQLRIKKRPNDLTALFEKVDLSSVINLPITNLEMETAGIYGLAKAMGHHAISFNALLANRKTGIFSQQPKKTVENMIKLVLERLSNDEKIRD